MKIYKGYELVKLINDNELKTGTKIKVNLGNSYMTTITYENFGLKWNPGEFDTSVLCSNNATFELIEEDIDIQETEELKTNDWEIPVTMLTKENLNKLEEHCKRTIHFEKGIEHSVVLELLHKYRKIELREQKLIEKLEEDIELLEFAIKRTEDYYMRQELKVELRTIGEILEILKGEKNG